MGHIVTGEDEKESVRKSNATTDTVLLRDTTESTQTEVHIDLHTLK